MDGNGRWAQGQGRSRLFGHLKGAQSANQVIKFCASIKIPYLTLYTFSTENWLRPREEIKFLMGLLKKHLSRELENLMKSDIQFLPVGNCDRLPEAARKIVLQTKELTTANKGMKLIFALSYGGRQEILNAVKSIAGKVSAKDIKISDINEALFHEHLETAGIPDPDLIIRTSGETRLSNFLLWQCAYSEFYVCDAFWPDFNKEELLKALNFFSKRERRFGKTREQLSKKVELLKTQTSHEWEVPTAAEDNTTDEMKFKEYKRRL